VVVAPFGTAFLAAFGMGCCVTTDGDVLLLL
jgi:hypothetical protein